MRALVDADLPFRHDFADRFPELTVPWSASAVPAARLLVGNDSLAEELGLGPLDPERSRTLGQLLGHDLPDGVRPVAQAYAGHQFGGLSPSLGDGRALLVGELVHRDGRLRDVHLKGSGPTPFSRGGDGKAALGPVLREHLMGEALYALGIPTTRALAVVTTGETVHRDRSLPGAVLVRVADSHLRIGTFQYAALRGDRALLGRLVEYAASRHHPDALDAPNPALALLDAVGAAQSVLVARWMLVGFVHGVMNTDNTTISGETIDYGPCALMDAYDPATVFSSIDHQGRYAYGNQPSMAQWNLARLAEALLPLIDPDIDRAVEVATGAVDRFGDRFRAAWRDGMRAKLGLPEAVADVDLDSLVSDLLAVLADQRVDHTGWYRALADLRRGEDRIGSLVANRGAVDRWLERWSALSVGDPGAAAAAMDAVNPCYVPRNHLVEGALDAAVVAGDLGPYRALLDVLADPFVRRSGLEPYEAPAPADFGPYRTFCGT